LSGSGSPSPRPINNSALHSDGPGQHRSSAGDDTTLPVATMIDARPAALVNGQQINWGDLRPLLNEAAGAAVLEEFIIDMMLERQLAERGLGVGVDEVNRERELLLKSLSTDPNVAMRLLEELRARRGLGEERFQRLLVRNARLRALVSRNVNVTDEQVRRLFEVQHGPKRQARLMVLPNLSMAQEAIRRVRNGRSFADVAVELSVDRSAARGGLLEPISASDPTYPAALRAELWSLDVGEISSPVLLDEQYAVLQLVRTLSADEVQLDDVRYDLQRAALLNQQRLLMDQLVDRMIGDLSVVIFDESLREAWKRRPTGQ
jgi:parvulin-like peptidyl-prolyl isomerase